MSIPYGRSPWVDVVRGVALFFMVVNHFGQTFVGGGYDSPLGLFILFCGIFPGPLFYTVAGISAVFSDRRAKNEETPSRQVWVNLIRRAVLIMSLGYLLSIVMSGWAWRLDWSVLQFIGVSLIVCQASLRIPWRYRLLLPLFFIGLAPVMRLWLGYDAIVGTVNNLHYQPPVTLADHLSAMLATGKVPIFPWLACPLIGTLLAEPLVDEPRRSRHVVCAITATGAMMAALVLPLWLAFGDTVTQYPLTNGFFLLSMGMSLLFVAGGVTTIELWHWWNPVFLFCQVNGKVALITYIAHLLYGPFWLGVIVGLYRQLDVTGLSIVLIVYFVALMVFAQVWLPFRRKRSSLLDVAAAFLLITIGLAVRFVLASLGFWAF
jgi:uncharacterized membrane protein